MSMGGHQSHRMGKEEWLTPLPIVRSLGVFDLDPCAPVSRPWNTARHHLTRLDDGLSQPWAGRVWMNPPYGRHVGTWLQRLADHGRGTALIFARTETAVFQKFVWQRATAALFLAGRLHFHNVDGSRAKSNAGAPSVLIAYGNDDARALMYSGIEGQFVHWLPRGAA